MILIYTCKYDNHHEIDCEEIAHRNLLKCYSNVALNDHSTPTSTEKRSDNDSLSLKLIDSKTLILLVELLESSWMVVTSYLIIGEQLIKKSLIWRCCSVRIFENKVFEFIKTLLLTYHNMRSLYFVTYTYIVHIIVGLGYYFLVYWRFPTHSKPDWLTNTQSRILQRDWLILEIRRQLNTLTCPIACLCGSWLGKRIDTTVFNS